MVFCEIEDGSKDLSRKIRDFFKEIKRWLLKMWNRLMDYLKSLSKRFKRGPRSTTVIQKDDTFKEKNPDLLFLSDLLVGFIIIYLMFMYVPVFKQWKESFDSISLTDDLKKKIEAISTSNFPMEKNRAIDMRIASLKSFKEWRSKYLDGYSKENAGIYDIEKGGTYRNFINDLIRAYMPYILLSYTVWVIIKYLPAIIAAFVKLIALMYKYGVEKIKCKLAEQWFIRFLFGWKQCRPNFSKYMNGYMQDLKHEASKEKNRIQRMYREVEGNIAAATSAETAGDKFGKVWGGLLGYLQGFWDKIGGMFKELYKFLWYDPMRYLMYMLVGFKYPMMSFADFNNKYRKFRGDKYYSVTPSGKICKCRPKTNDYVKKRNEIEKKMEKKDAGSKDLPKEEELDYERTCKIMDEIVDMKMKRAGKGVKMVGDVSAIWIPLTVFAVIGLITGGFIAFKDRIPIAGVVYNKIMDAKLFYAQASDKIEIVTIVVLFVMIFYLFLRGDIGV